MPDDDQNQQDDEELVLPEEDPPGERRRQRQRVDLPERAKTSPLLRRVIVGGLGDKTKGPGGLKSRAGSKPQRSVAQKLHPDPPRPQLEVPPLEVPPLDVTSPADPARPDTRDQVAPEFAPPPAPLPLPATAPQPDPRKDPSEPVDPTPAFDTPVAGRPEDASATPGTTSNAPRRRRRRKSGEPHFSEDTWAGKGGSALWWWISAGMACLAFVTALFVFRFSRPTPVTVDRPPERAAFDDSIESTPIAEFVTDSEALAVQLDDLLKRFETGEDLKDILRGGAGSAAKISGWYDRVPKPAPIHFDLARSVNAMAINNFGFVVLTGQFQDYSPFSCYFVKGNEGMQLDWEASVGFSEVLPSEVPSLNDREPRMMRVLVAGSNFYTDVYPEERFQCYTLQHLDPADYVWAFAVRESEVDLRLRRLVMLASPWGNKRRAMVMARRGAEGSRPNQMEVTELLFGDWIKAPASDLKADDQPAKQ